jgi:hypothetical protein
LKGASVDEHRHSKCCHAEARRCDVADDDDDNDHDPWHVNNDKLECCLPSCFNTSLVFESLGEDMIVVVMKDEMGSSGREGMT